MYEDISPYSYSQTYIDHMLFDERRRAYMCPKCRSMKIYIYRRPINNLYVCGDCGFSSIGAKGIYTANNVEYKFSDVSDLTEW